MTNPFRIRAYRNAARTIDSLTEPISVVDARPETVLENLPGIGADLARTIRRLTATGSVALLARLRARLSADELERSVVRDANPPNSPRPSAPRGSRPGAPHRPTDLGACLTISSDAHSAAELDLIPWGVDQARRGSITRRVVANTWPLATLLRRRRTGG